MEKLLGTGFLMLSLGAFAGHIDTHDLKVEQISVWGDSGDLFKPAQNTILKDCPVQVIIG